MFEYSKIKEELEQVQCPVHGKTAVVNFKDGRINFENICCEEHKRNLEEKLPEIEEMHTVADIIEDVF